MFDSESTDVKTAGMADEHTNSIEFTVNASITNPANVASVSGEDSNASISPDNFFFSLKSPAWQAISPLFLISSLHSFLRC